MLKSMSLSRGCDKQDGFTFIELVIAITILGILALIAIPAYNRYQKKAQLKVTETNLQIVDQAIEMYKDDIEIYPEELKDLVRPPMDSEAAKKWTDPFIKAKGGNPPRDGWNRDFVYKKMPPGSRPPYELYSWGPNGEGSPQDDWITA